MSSSAAVHIRMRRELTCPAALGLVEEVHCVEGVRELLLERVELLAEEDVLLGDVGEEEFEFGFVGFIGEGVGDDLVEGGAVSWY
jgi:hypothetical protein